MNWEKCLLSNALAGLLISLTTCGTTTIYQYNLVADFNMGGIKGAVLFQQENASEPLMIRVNFDSTDNVSSWNIQMYPVIYNSGASDSCNNLGGMIPYGNLTARHGDLGYRASYSDAKLRAFGNTTLLCRSLVLYYPNGTIRACSTILPFNADVVYAAAVFKGGPVAGKIEFIQNAAKSGSPTVIFGELYYADGRTKGSDNHGWYVSQNLVGSYGDCSPRTTVYDPPITARGTCSEHEQFSCPVGNLSSKLNTISIGIANVMSKRFRRLDQNLPLFGSIKVVGHGLVIKGANDAPLACANIVLLGAMSAQASFTAAKHDGVSGSVSFNQQSPYHPTLINFNLAGLANRANGIHVHVFPIPTPEPASPCANTAVAGHLNPYGVSNKVNYPSPGAATLDRYEVGDISSKFGTLKSKTTDNNNYTDYQMDMYGLNSILGRALVIHRDDAKGSRWVCSNIVPTSAKELSATANFSFTSDLVGTIQLKQYILSNTVATETTMVIDISHKNSSQITPKHNWHVHEKPVGDDGFASNRRCVSVGPHYNPYAVNVTNPAYSTQCKPAFPFRCELGDINGKQAQYDIGGGKKYFIDQDVPLFGTETVNGRSITIHTENGGAPRLACADIVPDIGAGATKASYEFKTISNFQASTFVNQMSGVLRINSWQISYIKTSEGRLKHCTKAEFYVLDTKSPQNATAYLTALENAVKNDPSSLGDFKPCKEEISATGKTTPSVLTIFFAAFIFIYVFVK